VPATWERAQARHGRRAPRVEQTTEGTFMIIEGWQDNPGHESSALAEGAGYREDCSHEYVGLAIGNRGQDVATERHKWTAASSGTFTGLGSFEAASFRKSFRFEDYPGPGLSAAARLKDMDRDGVQLEVLYASQLRHIYELSAQDEPFFHDIAESYNEWLLDYAAEAPDRLVAQPVLSVLNPERSADEIRAYVKRGAKGFQIASSVPMDMSYGDSRFDPIWDAAQTADVPLAMHTSTGRWKQLLGHAAFARTQGSFDGLKHARSLIGGQIEVQVSLAELIYGGVFDRFPKLKIVCAEYGIGWVGFSYQKVSTPDSRLSLKHTPAEYLARNVWFTFQDDRAGCLQTPLFGEDNFMWASDYPHPMTTWPQSRETVERQFEGLPERVKHKITRQNVIDLYKLDVK